MASPIDEAWVAATLAWLGTYALHSTLLLGAAWAITSRMRRGTRLAEWTWRSALLGGLLTASLQLGLGVQPWGGAWNVSYGGEAAALVESFERASPPPASLAAPAVFPAPRSALDGWPRAAKGPVPATLPARERAPLNAAFLAGLLVRAWLVLAGLGGAGVALAWLRVRRRLCAKREILGGPLYVEVQRLRRAAGIARDVRLFVAPNLAGPVALGLLRPYLVLPARAGSLDRHRLRAILAHETAHVARLDALWSLVAMVVERLLFFQPLNRLARRRLSQIAEYQCDDWAVARTGSRLALARSLTEVAAWLVEAPRRMVAPEPAAGMTRGGSLLALRVERILDEDHRPATGPRRPWLSAAAFLLLSPIALVIPGVIAVGELPASAHEADPAGAVLRRVGLPPAAAASSVPQDGESRLLAGIAALDDELDLLERERSDLGALLAFRGLTQRYADVLEEMERRVERLTARREELHALLPAVLDAVRHAPERDATMDGEGTGSRFDRRGVGR